MAAVPSLFLAVLLVSSCPLSAQDPVMDFIVAADSIYRGYGDGALADYVGENRVLVGAAVHQLIDIAIIVGDQGSAADEKENIDFARLVAGIYRDLTGGTAPLDLVTVYEGWSKEERDGRARGKELEDRAKQLRGEQDFAGAEKALLEAIDIYTGIGDGYSEAVCWGSLGVVAWYAGDFELVKEYYGRALEKRRSTGNAILEGRTLNGLGTVNMILEDFDASEGWYLEAIELRRRTGDISGLITSLTYLGNVYGRTERLVLARRSYQEALGLLEGSGDRPRMLELLMGVASLYIDLGQNRLSTETYREALEIASALEDMQAVLACRLNIALNLIGGGRLSEAMGELDAAEELLDQVPEQRLALDFYRNRFLVYLERGELDRAREDLLVYLAKSKEYAAPSYEMDALIKLGYLYLELGAYERGLASSDSARVLAEAVGDGAIARETHVLSAQIETIAGAYEKALEHWRLALESDSLAMMEMSILEDNIGIANVMVVQGRREEARELYEKLEARCEDAGAPGLLVTISLGLGHSWEKDDPGKAMEYYERALGRMEESRVDVGGAAAGSGFLGGSRRYLYEEVARFCAGVSLRTGDERWSEEAFGIMERARARGLLDLLESSLEAETSAEEEALLDSIYCLDESSPDHGSKLERLQREYERIRGERINSSTAGLSGGSAVSGLDKVKKALPKGTVMLAYAMGDSLSLLWAVDRKGCDLFELPDRRELHSRVAMFRDALMKPGTGDKVFAGTSAALYEMLVGPAAARVEKAKELLIIPDGCLFELPFEALLKEEWEEGWKEAPFLARSGPVFYAPSASVYIAIGKKMKKHDIELLAAGDPDYSMFGDDSGTLRPLPFTRSEVEGIGENFKERKRRVLVGAEANESALKQSIRDPGAGIIHIAAHGLVRPAEPAASSIALCPDPGGKEDGYLHTLEILALPVDSRLVVLSACESARGRIGRGEGVVGLSRAFIAAGAASVVASQWAVPDESTSILMMEFYRQLIKKKKPAHEALNKARMELLDHETYSHPFYWSPFVIIGAGR
jgi:CHAT domain-containing protein/Tfp pilus assembly protein PilF